MVVHPTPNLLHILFSLKGSIARKITKRTFMVTTLAALIVMTESLFPTLFSQVSATPFTLLGISLSIFMSFRNNACYARWWEGRQAWGTVITEVRSFIRANEIIENQPLREIQLRELCGYTYAMAAKLRGEDPFRAARPWLREEQSVYGHNVCDGILRSISRRNSQLAKQNEISEWRYILLEERLQGLSEAQAGCERIKTTPVPFPYTLLFHRTTYIFCMLLPFAMAQPLGWIAPLFTTIVSYAFFGLDAIGDELEDPFGREENALPLDALVRIIERNILDTLNVTDLPPERTPVDYILS